MSTVESSGDAEHQKRMGNQYLEKKEFANALLAYTQAISLDSNNHVYYSNRSACHSLMKYWAKAEEDAKSCIELDPGFSKGFYRLAIAHEGQDQLEQAVTALEKVTTMEPNDSVAKKKLAAISQRLQTRRLDAGEELLAACAKKRWSKVRSILASCKDRIDLERRGQEEWHFRRTPLLFAVCDGQGDIVSLLLDKGANIRAVCNGNLSAMGWAVHYRQITSVKALLKHGFSLHDNKEPIFDLCFFPALSHKPACDLMELCRLLVLNGADVNAFDKHINSGPVSLKPNKAFSVHIVHGFTPIFAAIRHSVAMCKLFLDNGADVNISVAHRTPLMEGLCKLENTRNLVHLPAVLCLLQYGARLDTVQVNGAWPDYCEGIAATVLSQIVCEAKWYRRKHFMRVLSALRNNVEAVAHVNVVKVFETDVLCTRIMTYL